MIKNVKAYETFPKLVKVITTCKTIDQCTVAMKYVAQYVKFFKLERKTNPLLFKFCGEVVAYLIDTKEHIEYGYHYNKGSLKRVYPDINDYVDLPGIKFKNF